MHVLGSNDIPVPVLKEHETSRISMKNKYLSEELSYGKSNVSREYIIGFVLPVVMMICNSTVQNYV